MAREDAIGRKANNVRLFREPDVDDVLRILQESPEAAGWSREGFLETAAEQASLALVFESEGTLAGFLIGRLVRDQAEILNLAVARKRRRAGVATALLEAALAQFSRGGGESVYLEVRDSNAAAIAFYAKHGFATVGRRENYYDDPPDSAVTMARKLTG